MNRSETISHIVEAEFSQFDRAKNEGGRASCQNDWETFDIMRRSQYMTWPDALLDAYLAELEAAEARGWNMVAEKYARMEKYTAPDAYEKLKAYLPERSAAHDMVVDQVAMIQVHWMEEFAKTYPKLAANARSIHAISDTPMQTSYETYLKGELGTYSDDVIQMYGRFIVDTWKQGKNLAEMTMRNTAMLYGYADLAAAEAALKG